MNLHGIDWAIIGVLLALLGALAVYVKRFNRGAADFLAANRCAGRYLLTISQGIAAIGVVGFVAVYQQYYNAGFSALWWNSMLLPLGILMQLGGWIIYRYRETRVLTMAQMFEIRYSRKLRVFFGILAWLAGVINMGIFPAVTAKVFIYVCGFPETFSLFGFDGMSTFVTIMLVELTLALIFIYLGGMIVVIVTDFIQGMFCNVGFLIILAVLLFKFDWGTIIETLQTAPADASMLNPFKTSRAEGFNLAFFMMYLFLYVHNARAWQGAQGYNAAARNAHEAKMAGVIGYWRQLVQMLLMVMLPVCAFVLMNNDAYASIAQEISKALGLIENEAVQHQMIVPLVATKILPAGVLGFFVAVLFAATLTTDDTYLHSWGSIFIQDVILPFRKKPFAPKQHMRLLKLSALLVAFLVFLFSLFFRQNDYILMFMYATGAIVTGGAGSLIVGGLYWKRGTTAAAWAAMVSGSFLATTGVVLRIAWPSLCQVLQGRFPDSAFLAEHAEAFPLNGMHIAFWTSIVAVTLYVSVSLWQWLVLKKPAYNMNRMLHRGKYALKGEHGEDVALPPTGWRAMAPTKEYSRMDKVLHYALLGWGALFLGIFIVVTLVHFIWGTSDAWWIKYWSGYIWLIAGLGLVTTVWFLIGGLKDTKALFVALRSAEQNDLDDGRVVGHHSAVDESLEADRPDVVDELKADK